MNPFDKKTYEVLVDDPKGRRVILECEKCRRDVFTGKYFKQQKLLTWKCDVCHHESYVEIDLNE